MTDRRTLVAELLQLGQLPTDAETDNDPARLESWEQLLDELGAAGPLSEAEARRLVGLFPPDDSDCYGVAWTLVHLVESVHGWPDLELLRSATGHWPALLRKRAAS